MSNLNRSKIEELIAKWREEWNIFFPRWIAQIEEELKDSDKGPILREQLRKFIQPRSETGTTEDVIGRQATPATNTRPQRTRRWMHMHRRVDVTITLPKYLLEAIEGLAQTVEKTRSAVIEAFAEYCLDHEDIIDKLLPF
jgi:hypothetical protein